MTHGQRAADGREATSVRVRGLVALARQLGAHLTAIAREEMADTPSIAQRTLQLSEAAANHVGALRSALVAHGVSPADLPVQSRQAYQWLAHVSDPESAVAVARTLHRIDRLVITGNGGGVVLQGLQMYPTRVLFRAHRRRDGIDLTVHLGFVDAPDTILQAVLSAARGRRAELGKIRAYAMSAQYMRRAESLEALLGSVITAPVGHVYDLDEIFEKVNHRYFEGALDKPRLRWSRRNTVRKMGHYDSIRDTVMLSQSLDSLEAPALLVEYVMFHELLHKKLGVRVINGRTQAHTPAFRRAERRFVGYDEARRLLDAYAGSLD